MRRTRSIVPVLVLSLVLSGLAACGGGDGTTGPGGDDDDGDVTITSVTVSPATASVAVGETVQLSASAQASDGSSVSTSFEWTSQDVSVATVSSSGVVTGVAEGQTAVVAEADGVSGSSVVDVSPPSLEGTMASVEEALDELMPPPGTPFAQRDMVGELRTLAQALVQRPEIMTTRVDPTSQTLQIDRIDGMSILVANSRPPHPDEALAPGRGAVREGLPVAAAAMASGTPRVGPPSSGKAVWISIDGGASVGAEVGALFGRAGYDVSNPEGSLDDMRALSGLGALYLDTHGVVWTPVLSVVLDEGGNAVGKVDGDPVYALQTTTIVDVSEFAALQEELENREIVVNYSQNAETERWEAHLAITERFIDRHWGFDEAVVMIHACNGGRGPVAGGWDCFGLCDADDPYDPTPLRSAILAKGAEVVVAFDNITWPTNARPSILYFFDRLLGTNEHDPEVIPNRPFDLADVMAGMQRKDLLQFELGSAEVNVVFDVADNRVTLAPAIENMDIVDDAAAAEGELTLHGTFGGDPGEVEVDGTSATVETWSDDMVTARVPFEGAGARGDVVAIKPDGVEGNGAPLTEWEGTVKVTV
ncbi:MAG: Ig-like domain-containing protein, partial [Gemmatimonadota bacterium]